MAFLSLGGCVLRRRQGSSRRCWQALFSSSASDENVLGLAERRPNLFLRKQVISDLELRRDRLSKEAQAQKKGWSMTASLLIERTPIVVPDPEPWQDAMYRLRHSLEKYDTFDWPQKLKDLWRVDKCPEDLSTKCIPFPLAPRVTQFDRDDDRHSLERALPKSLFLLLRSKKDGSWYFPEAKVEDDDEKMRPVADRAKDQKTGTELYTYLLGNAPIAVWFERGQDMTKAEREIIDDTTEDIFVQRYIFKSIIVDPYNTDPVVLDEETHDDYAWITKEEFTQYLPPDSDRTTYLKRLLSPPYETPPEDMTMDLTIPADRHEEVDPNDPDAYKYRGIRKIINGAPTTVTPPWIQRKRKKKKVDYMQNL